MADFRINVIVDPNAATRGTRAVSKQMSNLEKQSRSLRGVMRDAFLLVGIGGSIKSIVDLADTYTLLQNRLRTVTDGQRELAGVTDELFKISNETRASFDITAEVYARTAAATKNLGLSQRDTLKFTKSLNQAVALSGASSIESKNALIQFSQGMASGALRGDELRSVLEQLPKVADVIAERLGIGRGELKTFAAQGKVTSSEIIKAFQDMEGVLDEQFSKSVATLGQSFQVLRNQVIQAIGEFDAANGVTASLAAGILYLSNNVELLGQYAQVAAIALGPAMGLKAATLAMSAYNAVLLINPFIALAAGAAAVVGYLYTFRNEIMLGEDQMLSLSEVVGAAVEVIGSELSNVTDFFKDAFSGALKIVEVVAHGLGTMFGASFDKLDVSAKDVVNTVIGHFTFMAKAIPAVMVGLPLAIAETFIDGLQVAADYAEGFVNYFVGVINRVRAVRGQKPIQLFDFADFKNPLDGARDDIEKTLKGAFKTSHARDFFGEIVKKATASADARIALEKKIAEEAIKTAAALDEKDKPREGVSSQVYKGILENIAREGELQSMTNAEKRIGKELDKIQALNKHLLSDAQVAGVEAALRENEQLRIQGKLLQELRGPQDTLIEKEQALIALRKQGVVSLTEYDLALQEVRVAQAELALAGGEGDFTDRLVVGMQRVIGESQSMQLALVETFGAAGESIKGALSDALTQAIVQGETFKDVMMSAATTISQELLSSVIEIGINQALNAAQKAIFDKTELGDEAAKLAVKETAVGVEAASVAATIAGIEAVGVASAAAQLAAVGTAITTGTAMATAYASAAALASLASYGGNAAPAMIGINATNALTHGLALFADGGKISGPGTGRSDDVPIMASNGEYVMTAAATRRFEPLLERMNNGQGVMMATGGKVKSSSAANDSTSSQSGDGVITEDQGNNTQDISILNIIDPSSMVEAMGSQQGKKQIINTIRLNKQEFRSILGV